jgi:ArsR family transcriptional regulator, arsenate/arsenite/antimonite-responsive transcriptional repressor / arsenate reductase (thioredoxin)
MDTNRAASMFATLGHPGRLAVLRLLMRFAPRAQRPTEMALALNMKQNTLSHHLSDLAQAGLVQVTRDGRSLFYAVNLPVAQALIGYLTLDLARARPDLLSPPGAPDLPLPARRFQVLFLCSGNSARSIMAQALLRDLGAGQFVAHSAGTEPRGQIAPETLQVLQENGHETASLYSKSLARYQAPGAPQMDFVFTVCDMSAMRDCPPWPGQPMAGHWGLPDPVRATGPGAGPEAGQAFAKTYAALRHRITEFVKLPIAALGRAELQTRLDSLDTAAQQLEKA